jgi:ABC-2 type transport system permease protein
MNASAMRLRGLVRKEIMQILRDPSAILIAFLMPVVLIVVNGFGISLDASEMKLAVVIEAPEETARGLMQAIDASPYLSAQRALSTREAETALTENRVRGVLILRDDFTQRARRSASWPAPAQLVVNATDPNTARILEGYVAGALQVWLSGEAKERRVAAVGGVDLEYRDWFNPELRSADFIVPGIIAMVMRPAHCSPR